MTAEKNEYDDLAVQYFSGIGWRAFSVNKRGRYADVIGISGDSIGIVEVKSPRETAADRQYDDAVDLSPALQTEIGSYLKEARTKIFDFFGSGRPIQKLYAVSLACQNYRYVHEFDEKASEYEKAIGGTVKLSGRSLPKVPFLAVPLEYSAEAQEAMNALRTHGYIKTYRAVSAAPLFIIEASLRS